MTDSEWLGCADPNVMLQALRGKVSDRKLRLFAVACSRRIWHLLTDRWSRRAIKVAERAADGLVDDTKLKAAWGDARRSVNQASRPQRGSMPPGFLGTAAAAEADAWMAAARAAYFAAAVIANATSAAHRTEPWLAAFQAEQSWQADLLRDLFPNGPLPVSRPLLEGAWGELVREIARGIYDKRQFADLPVLADALEEAGCTDGNLLEHLRNVGLHTRGCWALDLILGI
ncbi:MAG: hypothetical protein L0Z62_39745 [Gemmataceae bacterium]|nr:hypothetical protein [Gemmataceae bacterium]